MKVDKIVEKLTAGHTLTEALTLAAGGAGLTVLDAALKKYIPANFQAYGVVGGVNLLPAAAAALAHEYVKDKRVKEVAKAIVAASVVRTSSKAGEMAAEMLGLSAPGGATAGVKFIPNRGMGKVEYFPNQGMRGVEYFPNQGMGAVQDPSMLVPQDRGDFNGGMGQVVGIDPDTRGDFEGMGARQYQNDADFQGYPEVMSGIPTFDPEEDDV